MCGIAGFYHFDRERIADKNLIKKMTDTIEHRGPDGEGFYSFRNIALGHRRLSIIDLDSGSQPMMDVSENYIVVFNGELYNYLEIKQTLIKIGYNFTTSSDTEVLLYSYIEWGTKCVEKFNGMWSFAILDKKCDRLFISRDRLGEKPLFYALYEGTFVFASEIKSLIAYGLKKEIDMSVAELFFSFKFVPSPMSFYKNIFKLKPGYFLLVSGDKIYEEKYWDIPDIDENNMLNNKGEIYNSFKQYFEDSIRIRMRSDVPFGALLSGGLDSSSIVAAMSSLSNYPVETFTVGFEDSNFDESELAQLMAKKYQTNHHNLMMESEKFDETINHILFHFDEPFGDSSAIPTGGISKLCRRHVKMVLTGDGGDEILSGYPSYQALKFGEYYSYIPGVIQKILHFGLNGISHLFHGQKKYDIIRVLRMLDTSQQKFEDIIWERLTTNSIHEIKDLLSPNRDRILIEDYISDTMSKCSYQDNFYKQMHLNFKLFLPDDYLTKVDRMTMANSLEARVPFLDYRLVELMIRVHKNVKMQGLERKSVLKDTYGGRLPKQYLKAKKKGFRIPIREWVKQSEIQGDLMNLCNSSGIFDNEIVKKIILKNHSGIEDQGNNIWMMILLNRWVSI